MIFTTEVNQHWTDFSWTTAEMHHIPVIPVKLLWNKLKLYKALYKGDLTW